jgi:hypothetical protein
MLVYQRVPFFVVRWFHTGPCRPFFFRAGRTKELSITPRSTKQHLVGQWWRWYGICSVAFPHVWYACYTVYDYIITNHYIPVLCIYIYTYAWLIIWSKILYIIIYIYHCLHNYALWFFVFRPIFGVSFGISRPAISHETEELPERSYVLHPGGSFRTGWNLSMAACVLYDPWQWWGGDDGGFQVASGYVKIAIENDHL